ncbi:MAG: hypothetical protein ACR2KK_22200 [Acidimicrobiales bacterium]
MPRSRLHVWTLLLWVACLLAATAGHLSGPPDAVSEGATPAAVGVLSAAADAAVLPARLGDDVRVSAQLSTSRFLMLGAALAVLVGLPAVLRRRTAVAGRDDKRLRVRRHVIALRAPPLQLAG